ncbi:dystrotelin-like [Micropterus salmoides]|uniref:dystrotelin-like n=1 Tax=Micropterus salmoides TaxID=27706 RepID=UPI0018ED9CBE|nr:dystrotelin-like [Micropterus salmoides]
MTPMASKEHVLSWLKSEPRLLLWLPTLHRLAVSQKVNHAVRCHTCKTVPITGLRYRCMKCVNVHLCQTCFLTDRQTRKHKAQHPVLEFCTQPTWKESLSSLVHSARNNLLPRRFTQREADKTRILMWAESGETPNSAPPPSDVPTRLAASAVCHSPSSDRDVSHDALVQPPRRSFSSKALQTDEETPTHQVTSDDP